MNVDPTQTAVPLGVVLLLLDRLRDIFMKRNGSAPVTGDKARLIVQEELAPVRRELYSLSTRVEKIGTIQSERSRAAGV